jgi:hypothetical protein
VRGEALLWWFKDSPLQLPLVLQLPPPLPQVPAGAEARLRNLLIGNGELDPGAHGGARFTAGYWLDGHRSIGLEGSYFFLANHTTSQSIPADGGRLARALAIAPADGDPGGGELPGLPDVGVLRLTSRLQGAEANGVVRVTNFPDLQVEVLGGFRFLDLRENLSLAVPGIPGGPGLIVPMLDHSDAENLFFGWQLGARAECRLGDWFVNGTAKAGLGDMYERVNLSTTAHLNTWQNLLQASFQAASGVVGQTPVQTRLGQSALAQTTPGQSALAQLALAQSAFAQSALGQSALAFATSTLQGGVAPRQITVPHFTRHALAAVPEVGLNVGYRLTNRLRAFAGYDFLYLSSVALPGNPFQHDISVTQGLQNRFPGNPAGPSTPLVITVRGSEFWAQGISGGLEFRY